MIALGLGYKKNIRVEPILQLVADISRNVKISCLAAPRFKDNELALYQVSEYLNLQLFWIDEASLKERQSDCYSYSKVAFQTTGYGSIAEACALAAAGAKSKLIIPCQKGSGVTAALAVSLL